jgi:hypothetical protein
VPSRSNRAAKRVSTAVVPELPPQRHVVVFDCNVYLDVASLLGPPYSEDDFSGTVARLVGVPVPHPSAHAFDSMRAIAACASGILVGEEPLEVWSSNHINDVVAYKAAESTVPRPGSDLKGLGWSAADAAALVQDLVLPLVAKTQGSVIPVLIPDGTPPLDHEDGLVYGTCRQLASNDPLCRVYCVTNDRGFLRAYADGRLDAHTIVLTPAKFVALVRAARSQANAARMAASAARRPTIAVTTP